MEDVMPQLKGIAPDDFASMEKLLPGEWKEISSGIPLDGPSHDRGGTRGRHPEIQGKEKGHRRGGFQRGIKVIPGLRQLIELRQTSLNFTKFCRLRQTAQSYTGILQKPICSSGCFRYVRRGFFTEGLSIPTS